MKLLLLFLGLVLTIVFSLINQPVALSKQQCDKSYPDFCIPSPPPDLNCKDISRKNFRVLPPDPHRFDRDKDGIGCESRR